MPRNTSVTLGVHFDDFVAEQIRSGRHRSASEMVREGLRRVEEREQRHEVLRRAIDVGDASEDGGPLAVDAMVIEARQLPDVND